MCCFTLLQCSLGQSMADSGCAFPSLAQLIPGGLPSAARGTEKNTSAMSVVAPLGSISLGQATTCCSGSSPLWAAKGDSTLLKSSFLLVFWILYLCRGKVQTY